MNTIASVRLIDILAHAVRRQAAMSVLAMLAGMALAGVSAQAQAAIKFCNHTGSIIHVAIAYGQKDPPGVSTGGHLGVTAEGWWSISPRACEQVSGIDAGSHFLYYRAESKRGNWDGKSLLCVSNKPFTLGQQFKRERDRCKPGQYLAGFKRIDAAKKHYTMNLK